MRCIVCGKAMETSSAGTYRCYNCGHAVSDCGYTPSNCDIPMPQGFGEQKGWICPVCGRGVAPWADYCLCRQDAGVINVTTTTESVDLSKYYTLINDGTVPEAKL